MEETKKLDRFSYSKISTFKQCAFKYKLKYEDKNFLFSANIATDFGSLVHETEEAIALALQAEQPVNYVALKNKFIIETRKIAQKYPAEFFAKAIVFGLYSSSYSDFTGGNPIAARNAASPESPLFLVTVPMKFSLPTMALLLFLLTKSGLPKKSLKSFL